MGSSVHFMVEVCLFVANLGFFPNPHTKYRQTTMKTITSDIASPSPNKTEIPRYKIVAMTTVLKVQLFLKICTIFFIPSTIFHLIGLPSKGAFLKKLTLSIVSTPYFIYQQKTLYIITLGGFLITSSY